MHLSIKNKGPVTPKKNRVTAYEYEANSHPQLPQDDVTTMDDAKNEAEASSSSTRANRLKFFQHRRTTSSTSSSYCEYLTSSSQSSSSYAGPKPTGVDGCPLRSCLKSSSSYSTHMTLDTSFRRRTTIFNDRSICFSHVEIREYCREVGDNPTVSCGCPMSLGWKYNKRGTLDIDSFEADRTYNPEPCQTLSSQEREKLLIEIGGISQSRIMQGQVDAYFGRQLRAQTLDKIGGHRNCHSIGPRERLLIVKESAARKLNRAKSGISRPQEEQQLWDNAHDAARRKSDPCKE
mmetsp:Transcript_13063/g.28125  ORF Transcript_13063/g.28125 Transcript_13063/m.28125 type:complete len:291 (+) Transcript_13063:177-1049(+)